MNLKLSVLSLLALPFVGCNAARQYAEVVEIDPAGWYAPVEISFSVSDTTRVVDMQLVLRYDNIVSADSVELIVSTITPDSVMWSEPFTIYTPRGDQSIYVVETPYRNNIKWGQLGEYKVVLHPQRTYRGVTAGGVNIINNKTQ